MNFALSEEAVRLAKSTGIDEKIADLEKQDLLSQAAMPISNNSELLSWVNDLKKEGFYSQDDRYVEKLLWFIGNPEGIVWKNVQKEAGKRSITDKISLLILSGIPVSLAFGTVPDYSKTGFGSFSGMLGTLGAYIRNFYDLRNSASEARWDSKVKGKNFHNLIENTSHQDTYIHQYDMSVEESYDPFSSKIRYKILGQKECGSIKIDGFEPAYLIMMLKYANISGKHDETAMLAAEFLKERDVQSTQINNSYLLEDEIAFCARDYVISGPSFDLKNEKVYITPDKDLLIGDTDFDNMKIMPHITYVPEDISCGIRNIMKASPHGRADMRDMYTILKKYSDREFE